MKTETVLLELQREFKDMKQEIKLLKEKLSNPVVEPIIIERISEEDLTLAEKRHIRKVDADVKARRMGKFITLEEFGKAVTKRKGQPLE